MSDEDANERAERLDRKAAAERRDWRETKRRAEGWQLIETAPIGEPVLLARRGWQGTPVIAECNEKGSWCEYLGGSFYGVKVPFEPTHWMPLTWPEGE
jgi:hypothetical protein